MQKKQANDELVARERVLRQTKANKLKELLFKNTDYSSSNYFSSKEDFRETNNKTETAKGKKLAQILKRKYRTKGK